MIRGSARRRVSDEHPSRARLYVPPDPPRQDFPLDPALRQRLDYDDARLLAECEIHLHRTGGPGGQHRNKVSSAVRLVHRPSGATATASERRSQHENKSNALARLREALALYARAPLPERCTWPPSVQVRGGRLKVGADNPGVYHVLGLVLDALAAHAGVHQDAAGYLGVTPSSLARFLGDYPKALTEANRIRAARGLPPLRP
jgi:hypothetical protein